MPVVATLPPLYRSVWNVQPQPPPPPPQHRLQYQSVPMDCDAELMQGALELLGLRNHFSAMSMGQPLSPQPNKGAFSMRSPALSPLPTSPVSPVFEKPVLTRSFSSTMSLGHPSASSSRRDPASAPTSPIGKTSISSSNAPNSKVAQVMRPSIRAVRNVNKKRKRASRDEVSVLKKAFAANPLPPQDARVRIAQQLGWTPRKVKIWFQNERAKLRKKARDVSEQEKFEASTEDVVMDSEDCSSQEGVSPSLASV
jgi:hypothetical protein